jgi:flagellar motility protein MotE (MotC chaperone)
MFHLPKLLKKPRRWIGLIMGGLIIVGATSIYHPAKSQLAGDAGDRVAEGDDESEMLPVEECFTNESLGVIAADLERRRTEVEQKRLALEREKRGMKRARKELEGQIQEIEMQRAKLQDRLDEWAQRRTEERADRIGKLSAIMGEMKPAEAARVIEKTKSGLAVEVLLSLNKKHAAKVLAAVNTDKAVALTNAMSNVSR